jgi:hypothetical protein
MKKQRHIKRGLMLLPLILALSLFASCDLLVDALLPDTSESPNPADYSSELIIYNMGESDCLISVNGTEVTLHESGKVSYSTSSSAEYEVECLACPTGKTFCDFIVEDLDSHVSQRVANNPIYLSISKTRIELYVEFI